MASIKLDSDFDTLSAKELNTALAPLLDKIKELVKDSSQTEIEISRLISDSDKLEKLMSGDLEKSLEKVVDEVGSLGRTDKAEFIKMILQQVNDRATELNKQFSDSSRSEAVDAKVLEDVVGNAVRLHNKKSGYGDKKTNVKNQITASFDAASPEFTNAINNVFEINKEGDVTTNSSPVDLAMQSKVIHTAARKELAKLEKELSAANSKYEDALAKKDVDSANQYAAVVGSIKSTQQGIKEAVQLIGQKAGHVMSKEDKVENNALTSSITEKEIDAAREKTMTSFEKLGQGTDRFSRGLDNVTNTLDKTTTLFKSAGENGTKGMESVSGYMSDFGNIINKIGPGMFTLAGSLAIFGAAIGLATRAVGAYHEQLDVSRSMGDNASGLVKDLQNMHVKTLMDPAQLKSLADQVSSGFNVSLTRNQDEMQNVAIKQRLSERVMGKEYAADQMAALYSLKGVLAGSSPSAMMDTLANNTSALAKTMGISNKMALDQLKALHQNTKVLTDGKNKDYAAKIQKSFAGVEAGLIANGVSKEAAQSVTKVSAEKMADQEKMRDELKIMSKLLAENGAAAEDIRAGATRAGVSEADAIRLVKEAATIGTQNMSSTDVSKLAEITAASQIAQTRRLQEFDARIEKGGADGALARKERVAYTNMGLRSDSGIANSLKDKGVAFNTNMANARASYQKNDAGASATQDLNAILLKMGATNQTTKNEKINELIAAQSKEQQAKFADEMARIAADQGTTVEAIMADKDNPEKLQQLRNDAYLVANSEQIKKVAAGENISQLGSGIKDSSGKAVTGEDVAAVKQSKDFVDRSSKLSNTKVEETKDAIEKKMIEVQNELQNAITDLNPVMMILIGALGALTVAVLANTAYQAIKGGITSLKDLGGTLMKFMGGESGDSPKKGLVGRAAGGIWDGAKAVSGGIGNGIKSVGTGAWNMVKNAPSTLGNAASTVRTAATGAKDMAVGGFSKIKGAVTGGNTLGSSVSTGLETVKKSLGSFVEVAKKGGTSLGESTKTLVKEGLPKLGPMVRTAGSDLAGGIGKAAMGMLRFAGPVAVIAGAAGAVYGAFEGWGKAAEYFGNEAPTFSEKFSSAIGGALETVTFGLLDGAKTALWVEETFGGVWKGLETAWTGTMDFLSRQWDAFTNIFAPVIEAGKRVIDDITNIFVSPFKGIWALFTGDLNGAIENFTQMFTSFGSLFTTIPQLFSEAFTAVWAWIADLGQNFVYKIGDMWFNLTSWWEEFKLKEQVIDPMIEKIGSAWDSFTKWVSEFKFYDVLVKPIVEKLAGAFGSIFDSIIASIADMTGGTTVLKLMGVSGETIDKAKASVSQREVEAKAAEAKKTQDFAPSTVESKTEKGKRAIQASAFEGKNKDEIGTFLQENRDKLDKASIEQLIGMRDKAKSSGELSQIARSEEIRKQEKPKASEEDRRRATELATNIKGGVDATKTKVGELAGQAKSTLSSKDAKSEKPSTTASMPTQAKAALGVTSTADASSLAANARRLAQLDQDKLAAAAAQAGAGSDADVIKNLEKIAMYNGDMKKASEDLAAQKGISVEEATKQLNAAVNAGKIASGGPTQADQKGSTDKVESVQKAAGVQPLKDLGIKDFDKLREQLTEMLKADPNLSLEKALERLNANVDKSNKLERDGQKLTKEEIDAANASQPEDLAQKITDGIKQGYDKTKAVVSGTVQAGKESIDAGKKAYEESRASGKGRIESLGSAVNAGLGSLSAKYESGKKGSEAVGWDSTGGTSYGKYQIAAKTGTMDKFLKFAETQNPEVAARLKAAGPSDGGKDGTFAKEWKKLAAEGKLGNLEHDFIQKSHYDPAMASLKGNTGLTDMINGSAALQDVMWSTSVQHGAGNAKKGSGAAGIFNKVYKEGMSEEDLIKAVYAERGTKFGSSTEGVRKSVLTRFADEEKNALAMVGKKPQGAPTDVIPPTNPETGKKATTADTNNKISPQAVDFAKPKSDGGAGIYLQKPNAPSATTGNAPGAVGTQVADATKKAATTVVSTQSTSTVSENKSQISGIQSKISQEKSIRDENLKNASLAELSGDKESAKMLRAFAAKSDESIKKLENEKGKLEGTSEKAKDVPTTVAAATNQVKAGVASGAVSNPQKPELSAADKKLEELKAKKIALEEKATAAEEAKNPLEAQRLQAEADAVSKQMTEIQTAQHAPAMKAAQIALQQKGTAISADPIGGVVGGLVNTALGSAGLHPGLMPVVSGLMGGIGNGLLKVLGVDGKAAGAKNPENIKQEEAAQKKKTAEDIARKNAKEGLDSQQANSLIKSGEEQNKKLAEQNAMVAKQPTVSDAEKLQKEANSLIESESSNGLDVETLAQQFTTGLFGADSGMTFGGILDPGTSTPALTPALNTSGLPPLGGGPSSNVGNFGINTLTSGLGMIGNTMARAAGVSIPTTSGAIPTVASSIPLNSQTTGAISTITNATTNAQSYITNNNGSSNAGVEKMLGQLISVVSQNGRTNAWNAHRALKHAVDSSDVSRQQSIAGYGGNEAAAPTIA